MVLQLEERYSTNPEEEEEEEEEDDDDGKRITLVQLVFGNSSC